MKQIPLLEGNVLLIELPNRPRYITLDDQGSRICYYTDKWNWVWQPTPRKSWRIIGMLSEVTEEQAALVVPIHRQSIIGDIYKNFKTDKWDAFDALESLESAIEAEGYYLDENPIPEPDISRYPNDDWIADYNNAQSRVLDRSRCLLLGREDV